MNTYKDTLKKISYKLYSYRKNNNQKNNNKLSFKNPQFIYFFFFLIKQFNLNLH